MDACSETQPTDFEGDEIDHTDRVMPRHEAGAFTRVEDQGLADLFVSMAMGVTVKHEVDLGQNRGRRFFRVVDHENSPACPLKGARGRREVHAESTRLRLEKNSVGLIVVPVDTQHRNVESGESFEHGRTRDIAGMNDAVDPGLVEQGDDSLHIGDSIVGVADDADTHPGMLPRRSRPLSESYSARALEGRVADARQGEWRMVVESDVKSLKTIQVEKSEGVMTVTLNRPERLNAFTMQMARDWFTVLDDIDADDDVRVVIVTGAGRGFCAGADLSAGAAAFDAAGAKTEGASEHRDEGGLLTLRIYRCLKPIIAAVNGPAVGVGVTSILPMDIRLASTKARFGFVFARRGVVPEACSSWFLPRVVGINRAMEWVATGRVFEAEEALRGGLVSEVLEPDALLPRARELAREIVDNTSAVSVALARQMMWSMLGASHPIEAHRLDSRAMNYMGARADSREGVMSFLEKRQPVFPLRVSSDFPKAIGLRDEPPYES